MFNICNQFQPACLVSFASFSGFEATPLRSQLFVLAPCFVLFTPLLMPFTPSDVQAAASPVGPITSGRDFATDWSSCSREFDVQGWKRLQLVMKAIPCRFVRLLHQWSRQEHKTWSTWLVFLMEMDACHMRQERGT